MVFITSRDRNILGILASGGATMVQIQAMLAKIGRHTQEAEEEAMAGRVYSNKMTLAALKKRLHTLAKHHYIVSKSFSSNKGVGSLTIYALTEHGRDELIQNHNIPRLHIIPGLPAPHRVLHDLQVVECVRAIKKEAGKLIYDFELMDENLLKSIDGKRGSRSKAYPDLHVTIQLAVSRTEAVRKKICLEVDNNSKDPAFVGEKLHKLYRCWQMPIMVVSPSVERNEELKAGITRYAEKTAAKANDAKKVELDQFFMRVFFCPIYVFIEKGLLGTRWLNAAGRGAVLAPDNFAGNPIKGR